MVKEEGIPNIFNKTSLQALFLICKKQEKCGDDGPGRRNTEKRNKIRGAGAVGRSEVEDEGMVR